MTDDRLAPFNVESLLYGTAWLATKRISSIRGHEDVTDESNTKRFIYGGKLMKKKI